VFQIATQKEVQKKISKIERDIEAGNQYIQQEALLQITMPCQTLFLRNQCYHK